MSEQRLPEEAKSYSYYSGFYIGFAHSSECPINVTHIL
jgi:hypothetical protein